MTNDSGLFHQPKDLSSAHFNGWSYQHGTKEYLPLYEAKMLGHFDHRFSTYRGATQAQLNVGSLPRLTAKEHDDPDIESLPGTGSNGPKLRCEARASGTESGCSAVRGITNMRKRTKLCTGGSPAGSSR